MKIGELGKLALKMRRSPHVTATDKALLWETGGALWIKLDEATPRILAERGRMASAAAFGKGFIATWEQANGEMARLMSDIIE